MATKWENAELYLLFLSFLILIWLILRSNICKNKMSLRRWYTPSFNCLAATIGIDRDRPQSVMEAIDNCFAFRVADGYSGRPCKAIVCTPRVAVCDDFSSAVQSRWPIVCSIVFCALFELFWRHDVPRMAVRSWYYFMSVALVDSNQRSYIIYGRHTTAHAFFWKKTAKNFVVSIIIPNFALAFRPEAYYKTIVGW